MLRLDKRDRAYLHGEFGAGAQVAMRILTRLAEAEGARELIDIRSAHIDSALYQGPATLEFAERLADGGARVAVPSTLNVSGVDRADWRNWAVPADWAEGAMRQMAAYEQMGCRPTWTCAPYQTEERPGFGQHVAWGESSAVVFANSVLGARTERYPDFLDICCAVTGRVPALGLHTDAGRAGTHRFDLTALPAELYSDDAFYPVLGHWIGSRVGSGVPVLVGTPTRCPSEDDLKALGAAMASSGGVALFHWVGVTPEARGDVVRASDGPASSACLSVSLEDLRGARADLDRPSGAPLDMVVLGSPHFSLAEFERLIPLLDGRAVHPDVKLLVTTGRGVRDVLARRGDLPTLEASGARLTVDTCILTTPMLPESVRHLMTNSAKYAYYTPGLLGRAVSFGSLRECVESAVAGRVVRAKGGPW